MTHYADLSPCMLPFETQERLLAVGWLDVEFPFQKGDVDEQLVVKLVELLVNPWQPGWYMGRHECQFCRFSGGPNTFEFENTTIWMGTSNLFVPASGVIYVAAGLRLSCITSTRTGTHRPSSFSGP